MIAVLGYFGVRLSVRAIVVLGSLEFLIVLALGLSGLASPSLVKSFSPFPASPNNWSPLIVGAWMLLGVAVLVILKLRGGETWLSKAGEIVDDRTETAAGAEVIREEATHD